MPQQPGICMNRPALETIPPWVRNPANHDKGVLSLWHGHRRPCWALMDPAKVLAVPMDGTQCLNSLESFDLSYGAIAATVRSQSQRDHDHIAIAVTARSGTGCRVPSQSRHDRGHGAIEFTAPMPSLRHRGHGAIAGRKPADCSPLPPQPVPLHPPGATPSVRSRARRPPQDPPRAAPRAARHPVGAGRRTAAHRVQMMKL